MPFAILSLILHILRTGSLLFISVLRDVLNIDCLALVVILADCVVTEGFFFRFFLVISFGGLRFPLR